MPNELTAPAEKLAGELLVWYGRHGRKLPWRGTRDPYRIWISEVMLQQTQASVVATYYRRFLNRFGTAHKLAAAELPEVLELWSGLGYYSRARNLHAAARAIVKVGEFPSTLDGLRALSGFGPYTSAAVGSIAFGLPEPAIDGNAVRVYSRLLGLRASRAEAEPKLRSLVRPLLVTGAPGDINQAVMDLGQLVCTVRAPSCGSCPWRESCRARRHGLVGEIPIKSKARPRRTLIEVVAKVVRRERVLMARRQEAGLFGGLWELPAAEVASNPATSSRVDLPILRSTLNSSLKRELGLRAKAQRELASVDRVLTHRRLKLIALEVKAEGRPRVPGDGRYLEARFVPIAELRRLGLSAASKQLLAALSLW